MTAAEKLLGFGFERIGSYGADPEDKDCLRASFEFKTVPREQGVYVFISGRDVVYVGSSTGNGGGIRSRLKKYTKARDISREDYKGRPIHRLLRKLVASQQEIDVFIRPMTQEERFKKIDNSGLHADLVVGVEGWLIRKYGAIGNIRGAGKRRLNIRTATAADLPAVQRVLVETWHATYDSIFGVETVNAITGRWHTPEVLAAQLASEGAAFLVAVQGKAVIGTAYARPSGGNVVLLERLYILPTAQGQGVGRALYGAVLAHFPHAGAIRLEVEPRNARAIAFYKSLGFLDTGQGNACGGDSHAAIAHLAMERALNA